MGVTGLLPVLKSVLDQVHVAKYAGKTAGVDASGWLHKGAHSCPVELISGKPTDAYLNFTVQQIKLLREHDVTPVLVFDGAALPAKEQENAARSTTRSTWRQKALKLLKQEGADSREAYMACSRAVSVTNDMVQKLIGVLRRMGVAFYVAPYEADAQLAFLSRQKLIDVVISEDSDCVPYGCRTVIFKWSSDGWGSELKRRSLGANEELSFVGWSEEMFILLCVLSGCDYCPSVPGVGIFTAYKLVNKHQTPVKVLAALYDQKRTVLPANFDQSFYAAILTFRHHLVFDPRDSKLKMLNPLSISTEILALVDSQLLFLGNMELRDDLVAGIALGQIHPTTHESYAWKDAAAVVLEQEQERLDRRPSVRSMTSSESSVLPRAISSNDSELSPPEDVESSARPPARSSWTHLDSVLGSSAHILHFHSPKVSENFQPLEALATDGVRSSSRSMPDLQSMENKPPYHGQATRIRNPTNRRRDGKGSGFDGEVRCRVDAPRSRSIHSRVHSRVDAGIESLPLPLPVPKRPKISDSSTAELCRESALHPTPFTCGRTTATAVAKPRQLRQPLLGRMHTSTRMEESPSGSWVRYSRAMTAEEKWDRILQDEMGGSDSLDEGAEGHLVVDHSHSNGRHPLAPLTNQNS